MNFEPIAVIGQSCLLPGALSPSDLCKLVLNGEDAMSVVPEGYWRASPSLVMADFPDDAEDRTWTDRGGYVRGFETVFDAEGFAISADEIFQYDTLVHWVIHTAREALQSAGYFIDSNLKAGAIFGNLSYPSHSLAEFAEAVYIEGQSKEFIGGKAVELAGIKKPNPINRFMSGLPAHILSRALKLNCGSFALDAACASSLYAIKLACDKLHDREADIMLAGGINRSDDLIIHIGFCILRAMSRTGQSRPFHRSADGLVPAEGAGFVALKRLEDAVAAGNNILGVIRGVGLSNDGKGHGLLVPSEEGQERAMRQAYEISGIKPEDISLIECHATGTPVGDGVEIRSMKNIFNGLKDIPIGSIKSNLGHPITVSGVAGLIKVLGAMDAGIRPSTLHVEDPLESIEESPFRLLNENEPWDCNGSRKAVINNFGFGGNNAHLIIEQYDKINYKKIKKEKLLSKTEIAIVAIGSVIADNENIEEFTQSLFTGKSGIRRDKDGNMSGFIESYELPLMGLRFPPSDLDQTLPQQLVMLKATMEAINKVNDLSEERTGVFVGMGCDGEVGRCGACWRVPQWASDWITGKDEIDYEEWISKARSEFTPVRKAAAVVGAMPNISANRLSSQFNLGGLSFTVSAEELSGIRALGLAIRALRRNELDAAVVGAVDISSEPVHMTAAKEVLDDSKHIPGDAAVALIVKRLEDARRDGNKIYAIVSDEKKEASKYKFGLSDDDFNLTLQFGHSHAATGLVHVAAGALSCHYKALPDSVGKKAAPVLKSRDPMSIEVKIEALGGESSSIYVKEDVKISSEKLILNDIPSLFIYSGKDRQDVLNNLKKGIKSDKGNACLVIVASNEEEYSDLCDLAIPILEKAGPIKEDIDSLEGIYYNDNKVKGELAFVFTGSAGTYRNMGKDLLFAFPECVEEIYNRFESIEEVAGWIFDSKNTNQLTPEQMLWGSSLLSQAHAIISRKIFGLNPDAVIGFSSGESNSLFAMEAWNDMDEMYREFSEMGVFTRELGGNLDIIRDAWKDKGIGDVTWKNWGVMVSLEDAAEVIKEEPLAHILIINAPGNIVIGGQAEACERVIKILGKQRAYPLGYDVAAHCPEIALYKNEWLKLHRRKTNSVPGVRFYTGSSCGHYNPTDDLAAEAIFGMATHTLDFPQMIKNAWDDGVRIFVEHGPRDGCTRCVEQILGAKDYLAIPMDRSSKSSLVQIFHVMAQLISAGIEINYNDVIIRLSSIKGDKNKDSDTGKIHNATRTYLVHPPKVKLPAVDLNVKNQYTEIVTANESTINHSTMEINARASKEEKQLMAPAPTLPFAMYNDCQNSNTDFFNHIEQENNIVENPIELESAFSDENISDIIDYELDIPMGDSRMNKTFNKLAAQSAKISVIHTDFLNQQAMVQQRFLEFNQNSLNQLMNVYGKGISAISNIQAQPDQVMPSPPPMPNTENISDRQYENISAPVARESQVSALNKSASVSASSERPSAREEKDSFIKKSARGAISPVETKPAERIIKPVKKFTKPDALPEKGPTFSREQLEIFASGKISDVFGPMFEIQDDYPRQVRLPEGLLLLADRVTGIDAEPGSMKSGVMWTETDVVSDAWYMNDGYMPAGIIIEAGQCDLMLISYLGADFQNKGERVYRLLGCDLIYYGGAPKSGDTLCYEIHIDGHANVGDTRIFFFHYDCRINGEIRFSVRNAQAGFFSDEELARSGGVLWEPETGEHKPDSKARIDAPFAECQRNEFTNEQVVAFSEGRVFECFGPGFELAETHSKTPKLSPGKMLLIDRITKFELKGGPWKRGYIKAEFDIEPDAWFLACHFKNDPCMPGTLMSDACSQTLIFFLAAMGYTLKKDGWRFDLVPDEIYEIICRGQVTPSSKKIIYETYIEEIIDAPYPTVYADILATCDGLKILHIRRMGASLVPDWPLDQWPHLLEGYEEKRTVAKIGDMEFGYRSLLACAFGKPSEAFGEGGKLFDDGRHIARLPGPPYHFMTRVSKIDATPGAMQTDQTIEVEYDIPNDEWYFDENGNRSMPFCVLMEVALQPCGWLAVFEGGPSTCDDPLLFRNMDGTGVQHVEILPDTERILTRTVLTNIVSGVKGMTLVNFNVECFAGETLVYSMKTGFGFFLREYFEQQTGLPMSVEAKEKAIEKRSAPSDFFVDLTARPDRYCVGEPRLPGQMLLMIDRVTGYWPEGGEKGLGSLRGEKTVNVSEWFFKSHFFHDPVQPGSLGVEAMVQLLQFYMIHEDMHKGIKHPKFQAIALNTPVTWKYRGQVTPDKKIITTELNIVERGKDDSGVYAVAEAWLWADDLCIFNVKDMRMNIVPGNASADGDNVKGKKKRAEKSEINTASKEIDDKLEKSIKKEITRLIGLKPATVGLVDKENFAYSESMPFNRFPIIRSDNKNSIKLDEPIIDFNKLFSFSRSLLGIKNWFGEDFAQALFNQFTRSMILEDPILFNKVNGRCAIYLANHQVQIESLLFPMMIQVLTGIRTVAIANANHLEAWMGPLNDLLYSYPGLDYPRNVVYFDQQDRESMFGILDQFKSLITDEGISVFLHIEGKLGTTCREPVKVLSSVFIDLANDLNVPIVPTRFVGGLPVEKIKNTLEFPFNYCKQDYYVGNPIFPEELASMPYAERRKFVINAINNLGPSNSIEISNKGNAAFTKSVKSCMKNPGIPEVQTVFLKTMEMLKNPASETKILVDGVNNSRLKVKDDELGKWISKFANWLSGDRGVDVEFK